MYASTLIGALALLYSVGWLVSRLHHLLKLVNTDSEGSIRVSSFINAFSETTPGCSASYVDPLQMLGLFEETRGALQLESRHLPCYHTVPFPIQIH